MPDSHCLILWAEDDDNDALLVERAFKKAHVACALTRVKDGSGVVQYLAGQPPYTDRRTNPLPDLLLLDIKMPLKTGFDVLEWMKLQPQFSAMPAVILSSSHEDRDVEMAQRLGARAYLVKPSNSQQMATLVDSLAELAMET